MLLYLKEEIHIVITQMIKQYHLLTVMVYSVILLQKRQGEPKKTKTVIMYMMIFVLHLLIIHFTAVRIHFQNMK